MSRKDELSYIADTLLIERLYFMDAAIKKQAGLSEDFSNAVSGAMSGAKEAIQSYWKQHVDFSSPKNAILSAIELLVPVTLMRINPLIGMAANLLGGEEVIVSILDAFKDPLKAKAESGEAIDLSHINAIAKSLIPATESTEIKTSSDPFYSIRKIVNEGKLLKTAQSRSPRGTLEDLLHGLKPAPKGTSILGRIFPIVKGSGMKGLLVGLIGWFIKTVLLSIGMIGVGGAIKGIIHPGGDSSSAGAVASTTAPAAVTPQISLPTAKANNLQKSGLGEQFHPNDETHSWIVPLNGDVKNTVLNWAIAVYPELRGYDQEILQTPSFNRMSNILNAFYNPMYPNYLTMPRGVNKIIDVVDVFAGDIKKENEDATTT